MRLIETKSGETFFALDNEDEAFLRSVKHFLNEFNIRAYSREIHHLPLDNDDFYLSEFIYISNKIKQILDSPYRIDKQTETAQKCAVFLYILLFRRYTSNFKNPLDLFIFMCYTLLTK